MALAFAPAVFRLNHLLINNPAVVSKSYPQFWNDLRTAGFQVKSEE
jgi:3-phosphoshikimate 1-carboxyvinyltransferase